MDGEARHFEAIDCMRILPGNRLATKSGDGRMIVWDLAAKKQISCWKVKIPVSQPFQYRYLSL